MVSKALYCPFEVLVSQAKALLYSSPIKLIFLLYLHHLLVTVSVTVTVSAFSYRVG